MLYEQNSVNENISPVLRAKLRTIKLDEREITETECAHHVRLTIIPPSDENAYKERSPLLSISRNNPDNVYLNFLVEIIGVEKAFSYDICGKKFLWKVGVMSNGGKEHAEGRKRVWLNKDGTLNKWATRGRYILSLIDRERTNTPCLQEDKKYDYYLKFDKCEVWVTLKKNTSNTNYGNAITIWSILDKTLKVPCTVRKQIAPGMVDTWGEEIVPKPDPESSGAVPEQKAEIWLDDEIPW